MSKYSARELFEGTAAQLVAWEVPIKAFFGTHRLTPELHTENEVRFTEVPDADHFSDPSVAGGNPRPMAMRTVTIQAEIRGRSTAVGSDPETHRDVVRSLVHSVAAAILHVARAQRIDTETDNMAGGFVDPEVSEVEHGAMYRLRYQIAETVYGGAWATRATPIGHAVPDVIVINGTEHQAC